MKENWTEEVIATIADRCGTTSKAVQADIEAALRAACPADPLQKSDFTSVEDVLLYATASFYGCRLITAISGRLKIRGTLSCPERPDVMIMRIRSLSIMSP